MKNPFSSGAIKVFETQVSADKLAAFEVGEVHPVYSTFALGKDVEWACRLFVLEMKEAGEEGVGSFLSVEHLYPAPLHSKVRIEATLVEVIKNEVVCTWEAFANGHLIGKGRQIQKILNKSRFDALIQSIQLS